MDYIKDLIENANTYICPSTWIPLYQVLSAVLFGFFFGAFHKALIWTAIFYINFEAIYIYATADREYLYQWKMRLIAIFCGILAILFSKCVWGSYPLSQILLPRD